MARTRSSTKSDAQQAQQLEAAKPTRAATKRKREPIEDDSDSEFLTLKKKPVKRSRTILRECDICAEEIGVTTKSFPNVSTCDHDQTVCSNCYARQIRTNVESNPTEEYTSCNCPSCAQRLNPDEARLLMRHKGLGELNKVIKKAKLTLAHDYLWCPAPGCGHGQKHTLTMSPFVTCSKCKVKICFNHQTLWHEGQTCQQFDDTREVDENTKKNMEEIRRTTKPCPYCKMRVKKEGGCNHMTCTRCHKHWQWNTVPFDGEAHGTGAEVAGGYEVAPSLLGEALENVNLVNQFLNDGANRAAHFLQARFAQPRINPAVNADLRFVGVPQPARRFVATPGVEVDQLPRAVEALSVAQGFVGLLRRMLPTVRVLATTNDNDAVAAPIRTTPAPTPTPRRASMQATIRAAPPTPTRRSSRIRALTEGRLTVDLTQRDDPRDIGTEIIDLTHLD